MFLSKKYLVARRHIPDITYIPLNSFTLLAQLDGALLAQVDGAPHGQADGALDTRTQTQRYLKTV